MASKMLSLDFTKEEPIELFNDPNWETPSVMGIGKLLTESLDTCMQNAVRKITENGYTEEEAERVILKSGPFYGPNDMESNIVERALLYLKSNKEFDDAPPYKFQDLRNMVDYMTLEMVTMVREINPDKPFLDALCSLLVCDMNVLKASEVEINPELMGSSSKPSKSETGTASSQSESENQEPVGANVNKSSSRDPRISKSGKKVVDSCPSCKNWCPDNCHKHAALVKKAIHFEKSYKGRVKGALKAKIRTWGDLTVVKKQSSSSSSSSSGSVNNKSKNQSLPLKETKKDTPKAEPEKPPEKTFNHYLAHIPFDEMSGKRVAQDEKDKQILSVVDQLQSLTKELKDWDGWANAKIKQVAKRLGNDRPELNTLRGKKAEALKAVKDKLAMEENRAKRLLDMSLELNTTNSELHFATTAIVKLQSEQTVIRRELNDEDEKCILAAERLSEVLVKEQEDLKTAQAIKSERGGLHKDLKAVKCQVPPVQRELQKVQSQLTESESRVAKEEREAAKVIRKAESIENERLHLEELAKAEEETMKKKAEETLKKYENEQKKIEDDINAIKLDKENNKIEEMGKSVEHPPTRRLEAFRNITERANDWECVMCFERERKVVLVPCGHQVLCEECSSRLEKFSMNECPTCRTSILKRIIPRLAKS